MPNGSASAASSGGQDASPNSQDLQNDGHLKDAILDRLARDSNVAQFVSFSPHLKQRFAWIRGHPPNDSFASPASAVEALLRASPEGSVNIRSFDPQFPKSREFIYGRTATDEVMDEVRRLAGEGLHTIVNETVDVHDGGVSGVAFGNLVEFAPGDTPRCVEKPGTAAVPREFGDRLFKAVYGFTPDLPGGHNLRVEFSLHPLRRGYRHNHTIIWETEQASSPPTATYGDWDNRFSAHIGDKTFGLLMAHLAGLPVPRTIAVPRKLAPFTFGRDTGLAEPWIRSAEAGEQVAGRFTTERGWRDPYELMQQEDPDGEAIAAFLYQQGVEARYAGALVTQPDGKVMIEGVSGFGDEFMGGEQPPEDLPDEVNDRVRELYKQVFEVFGPVRFEWVLDKDTTWILQLYRGKSQTSGRVIYPGEVNRYRHFDVSEGLESFRKLVAEVAEKADEGIILEGRVGVTSHFGDLLRRARVPSRIQLPNSRREVG